MRMSRSDFRILARWIARVTVPKRSWDRLLASFDQLLDSQCPNYDSTKFLKKVNSERQAFLENGGM